MGKKLKHPLSSGNVYQDLNFIDSEVHLAKARLALRITEIIGSRGLIQAEAARILDINQPKVSALMNGQLSGFSIERLFKFLKKLDQDVEMVIKPHKTKKTSKIQYEQHLFAYLDILGFENLVKDKNNLNKLARLLESFHESQTIEKLKINKTESGGNVILIPNIMCFSDNIIMSTKRGSELSECGLPKHFELDVLMNSIMTYVSVMCIRSLVEGIALRGAVGYGNIYINYSNNKSILFGPELIDSIRDETKAEYPRIIISESFLKVLPKVWNVDSGKLTYPPPIIQDSIDNVYHVDFLHILNSYISKGQVTLVKQIAKCIIKNHNTANQEKHKKKWAWLKEYFNNKIQSYKSSHYPDNDLCPFTHCKHPSEKVYDKLIIADNMLN